MNQYFELYTQRASKIVFLFLTVCACTNVPDKIGALDLVQWRSDRGGCNDKRKIQLADFKSIEAKLLSEHINDVGVWLGRPDIHQLGRRDEKFYVYFLEKGTHCEDIKKPSIAQKVILRFNSVGLLSEITYQQEAL
jgi:hypothetical protein